jgi:1-acyl-sn-glycerol-3-phosphate acyltransferase
MSLSGRIAGPAMSSTATPATEEKRPGKHHRAAGHRAGGASYPVQAAAHLYFIASGLWLTARWLARRAAGMQAAEKLQERRGLQHRAERYLSLLARWNVLKLEFEGFDGCEEWCGNVLAPNHPSIMDAIALIARVPGLDCVMNSRLLRDPVMGGAAKLCDYICNDAPVRMLKTCRRRLAEGSNILIFPEATRTLTLPLGPFHQGYALAAVQAGAPIRTIFIECDSLYFGRDFSFFRPAPCPMSFRVTAAQVFETSTNDDARSVSEEIAAYFRANLTGGPAGVARRTA